MKITNEKKNMRKQFMADARRANGTYPRCPNCGGDITSGGHFAPPSFGDSGMWVCQKTQQATT